MDLKKIYRKILKGFSGQSGQGTLVTLGILIGVAVIIGGSVYAVNNQITGGVAKEPLISQVKIWDFGGNPGNSNYSEGQSPGFEIPDPFEPSVNEKQEQEPYPEGLPEELRDKEPGYWQGVWDRFSGEFTWLSAGADASGWAWDLKFGKMMKRAANFGDSFAKFANLAMKFLAVFGALAAAVDLISKLRNFNWESMSKKEKVIFALEVIADISAIVTGISVFIPGLQPVAAVAGTVGLVASSAANIAEIFWAE